MIASVFLADDHLADLVLDLTDERKCLVERQRSLVQIYGHSHSDSSSRWLVFVENQDHQKQCQ
jgi:hypothetical protein